MLLPPNTYVYLRRAVGPDFTAENPFETDYVVWVGWIVHRSAMFRMEEEGDGPDCVDQLIDRLTHRLWYFLLRSRPERLRFTDNARFLDYPD